MRKILLSIMMAFIGIANLAAEITQVNLLRKLLDTGSYSYASPVGQDYLVIGGVVSLRHNEKELIKYTPGYNRVVDSSVMILLERSNQYGLRLFFLTRENCLACASLTNVKQDNTSNYYFFLYNAVFDNFKGQRNVESKLSLYSEKKGAKSDEMSSIMFSIGSDTYEMAGIGVDSYGNSCNVGTFIIGTSNPNQEQTSATQEIRYQEGCYKGETLNNSPHGQGTFYFNNGDFFVGQWCVTGGIDRNGHQTERDAFGKGIFHSNNTETRKQHLKEGFLSTRDIPGLKFKAFNLITGKKGRNQWEYVTWVWENRVR